MNFFSLTAFVGHLPASSAVVCFFSARRFLSFSGSLIKLPSFCFASFNLIFESSSSLLFAGVLNPESLNEFNETIPDSNCCISFLVRSCDGVSYCFLALFCDVEATGSVSAPSINFGC